MRSIEEVEEAINTYDRIINLLKSEEDEEQKRREEVEEAINTYDRIINLLKSEEDEEQKRRDEIRLRYISKRNLLQWVLDEKKDDWI